MNLAEIKHFAAKYATEFRRKFDLGQSDPIRMDSLLKKLDILVVFAPMSSNFSGMAARFEHDGFLLINCSQPKGRQNFTICHELYHLFVQRDFDFEVISNTDKKPKDDHEKLADAFASELLMPEKGIQEVLLPDNFIKRKIEIDQIIKLEQYFQVSRQAMVYRLKNLDFFNKKDDWEQKYFSDVSDAAQKRGYTSELYLGTQPTVVSSDYFDKAQWLYQNERIGLNDYAQLLNDIGINLHDILAPGK